MTSPKTHKTPQLMRMLTGGSSAANPLLDEDFKAEIIRAEKEPQPSVPVPAEDGGTQINVTSEIISQWLPRVEERFNLCRCSRCSAEFTVEALDAVRPVIVKVRSSDDIKRAEKIKSEKQREIIMQLIRLAVARKGMPVHGQQ